MLVWARQRAGRAGTTWARKVWFGGVAFFLIKGLLWLTVPLILYWLG